MNIPYGTIENTIGRTPLVRLQNILTKKAIRHGNTLLAKLEGNNPAGSVKDRAAMSMIKNALARGDITLDDTLIEATSGNTGIALAMAARLRGLKIILVMPENLSLERRQCMNAYGAKIVLTPASGGMESARDVAVKMQQDGVGVILDQFNNPDNPLAHYEGTGPELWQDTNGKITHFVSAMGTTGTIMGVSRYLKEKISTVQIIGVQPCEGSQIVGIRKWSAGYLPRFYEPGRVDCIEYVDQASAESMARKMADEE